MTAPYETPDSVISASLRTYGKPQGLKGPKLNWLKKLLKRKPESQHFLLAITYRDYTQRTETVNFAPGLISEFLEKLLAAEQVRAVHCGELLFYGRKSFGADYDPANFLKAIELATPTKAGA